MFPVMAVAIAAAVIITFAVSADKDTQVWQGPLTALDSHWSETRFSPAVSVRYNGRGEAMRIGERVDIDWGSGTLEVDVVPNQGSHVSVHTQEAEISVVGTAFTVSRDVWGTSVEVARGHVRVHCLAGGHHDLRAESSTTCRPTTASGLLALARHLDDASEPNSHVLEVVESALEMSASEPVRIELLTLHVDLLARTGQLGLAHAEAKHALASGLGHREVEIRRLAADLATTLGDCPSVVHHIEAIPAPDRDAADLVMWADCTTSDSATRGDALRRALALDPGHSREIEARIRALP